MAEESHSVSSYTPLNALSHIPQLAPPPPKKKASRLARARWLCLNHSGKMQRWGPSQLWREKEREADQREEERADGKCWGVLLNS